MGSLFRNGLLAAIGLAALVVGGLLSPAALGATLYISEFAAGTSPSGSTSAQIIPQTSVASQTVALSGASAPSTAFNTKTHFVRLICDEGCSVKFGTTAPTAATTDMLLQQGQEYLFGVSPGWFVAAIANAAGNTSGGTPSGTQDVNLLQVGSASVATGGVAGLLAVAGNVAHDGVDAGNPVKTGCFANSSAPTAVSVSDRANTWCFLNGQTAVSIVSSTTGTAVPLASVSADGQSVQAGLFINNQQVGFNGTNYDRLRLDANVTGAVTTVNLPTTSSNAGIAPSARTTAGSSQVICAAACNLYSFSVLTGATNGIAYVFNATSLPSNGAVTPVRCYVMAANQTLELHYDPPLRLGTGATIGFGTGNSPTECFSLTASATAFIAGEGK